MHGCADIHAYLQIDCGKDQDVLPGKIAREYRALKIAAHLLRDLGNRRIDEVMIKVVLILVQAGFLEVIMQELRAVIDVSRCLYLLAVPGDEQIGTAILDQKLPDRGDIMAERIFTDIELLRQIDELEGPVWIGEQQDGQLMNPLVIRGIVRDLGISDRKAAVISVAMVFIGLNGLAAILVIDCGNVIPDRAQADAEKRGKLLSGMPCRKPPHVTDDFILSLWQLHEVPPCRICWTHHILQRRQMKQWKIMDAYQA